ncbi:MAG: ribosomal-processing cysteine protease Prp [Clostridiaceae bacterium]|nr:ribosomal-processing cysteine protease Prp [Clostridiaceae bacterium]
MIKISIIRNDEGFIREFTVKGHAGYAEEGSDIICSAVSVLAYTAAGALKEMAGIDGYTEKHGFMKCTVPADISGPEKEKAEIILETIVLGFKQIEHSYKKFVSVLDKEV